MKHHLHAGMPESIDIETLKKEVEELKQKNHDLEGQVSLLQAEVRQTKKYKTMVVICISHLQLSKYTDTEVCYACIHMSLKLIIITFHF